MSIKSIAALVVLFVVLGVGCSNANYSAMSAWGRPHTVTLYACDGHVIHQWRTTGKIENEEHSNGYYFTDAATGKLVMVDGTVVIEVE